MIIACQGVAQLVARAVRDCEVVGSNPITLTIQGERAKKKACFFLPSRRRMEDARSAATAGGEQEKGGVFLLNRQRKK